MKDYHINSGPRFSPPFKRGTLMCLLFAKPFANQITVFAEPIRLIIGFAKNVFTNNIQKSQKTLPEIQKKNYSRIGFAKTT